MRKPLSVLSLTTCLVALPLAGCLDQALEPAATDVAPALVEQPDAVADSDHTQEEAEPMEASQKAPAAAVADSPADGKRVVSSRSADKSTPAKDASVRDALSGVRSVRVPGAAGYKVASLAAKGARGTQLGGGSGGVSTNSLNSVLRSSGSAKGRLSKKSARVMGKVAKGMPAPRSTRMRKAPPMPPPAPKAEPVFADQDRGGTFVHAGTNPFTRTDQDKLSTFSIDVDTASYTYARRFLKAGNRPGAGSVRVEEWINAFHYEYDSPRGAHPFGIHMEAGPSPLSEGKHLLRVGIQGKRVSARDRKPVHLTFLVDTSGSMRRGDKLPLAQKALHHLVDNLERKDSVALITYAGSTTQVLGQTSAKHKRRIHKAIDSLMAGGGTAMGSGMEMAYRNAGKFVAPGSVSRVIVLSDGDANIGRSSHQAILKSIKGYVSEGIKLSTVGFGTGNYRDHLMEQLADAGDGNYSYIDSFPAAKKIFGTDLSGTLQVIAKDVKIQVEMNPRVVKRYRLLGYENRDIADRDFRNDKVDAGEIGAGHSVTALYEVELQDPYNDVKDDVATVRVRYKQPRGMKATEVARTFTDNHVRTRFGDLSRDTRWAAAVSVAAEVLRGSPYAQDKTLEDAWSLAAEAAGGKYRTERRQFVDLLDRTVKRGAVAVR